MARVRETIRRVFHPKMSILVAIVLVTIVGEIWCFALGGEGTPLSYVVYLFSAYALAVVVIALIKPIRRLWKRIASARLIAPIVESEALRGGAVGVWSVLFDLAYAVVVMVNGYRSDSNWAIAVALYHIAIAAVGFSLAFGFARARSLAEGPRVKRELSMVRSCGVLLALMAFALSGVMIQMVVNRQAWEYSEVVVIAYAAFTFVNLSLSIRSAILVRRAGRPSIVASRAISLSKTLVQLFFLETTMIAVFGEGDESFRFTMEAATGSVVIVLVIAIAIALVVYAIRAKRSLRQGNDE